MTEALNIKQLRLEQQELSLPRKRSVSSKREMVEPGVDKAPTPLPGDRFLWGRLPWDWITAAGRLPNKALQVGLCLWHLSGMNKRAATVSLNLGTVARDFGGDRSTYSRGLKALEDAGLVRVERRPGAKSLVTILAAPPLVDKL